ncbi:hypothetical protein ASD58_30065 [Duganella sp. Root1480D1]|nr:hypothetical protein ASD58_30065 [Duganella sp. Root1480D1]
MVVGTPVANRQRSEVEGMIGFFVNTLALRMRPDGDASLAQLLAQARAVALGGFAHQDVPFEQVVERLKPARSLGYSPVFQSMLSLNNTPASGELALPGLTLSRIEQAHESTQFDVSLSVAEEGQAIACSIEYARDLFDGASIERMARQLESVLGALAAESAACVAELPLLDAAERERIVYGFNAVSALAAPDWLVHEAFERHAAERPEAPAVLHADGVLSYGELNRRANRVAHRLLAAGVKPDARVALSVRRGPGLLVGLLAILKAGGAYVPLDPDYPAQRLAHMLQDSAPVALLTESALAQGWLEGALPVLLLDQLDQPDQPEDAGTQANPAPRALGLEGSHLAYVIYTSGSSGTPKGVMVEHRQLAHLMQAHGQTCALQAQDRVLQFAPYSFDSSVAEIFPAWAAGAAVVLRPDALRVPDDAFVAYLAAQGVTVADLPTAFWQQWVQQLEVGACTPPAALRLVIVSGEKVERRDLLRWLAEPAVRHCRWINNYGPTEATVNATAMAYDAASTLPAGEVPIGRPIAGVRVHLLDARLQPVPVGVAGELHIGGAGVARGYLHRPELTAERFIADPFLPGARLYKTGDLARYRPDGEIEYLGRNDFQVKLRGYRIELGEIESRLAQCEGVRAAVVLLRNDAGGARLVAYLQPLPDAQLQADALRQELSRHLADYMLPSAFVAQLQADALRQELSRHLADYMLPSAFVLLEQFPLTPNGKLDRQALPEPGQAALPSAVYEPPQGETESALARLWQELLGVPRVSRHDDFFSLGGHSLLAVKLTVAVRAEFEVELPLQTLFAHPGLIELADTLLEMQLAMYHDIDKKNISHELDSLDEGELRALYRETTQ